MTEPMMLVSTLQLLLILLSADTFAFRSKACVKTDISLVGALRTQVYQQTWRNLIEMCPAHAQPNENIMSQNTVCIHVASLLRTSDYLQVLWPGQGAQSRTALKKVPSTKYIST